MHGRVLHCLYLFWIFLIFFRGLKLHKDASEHTLWAYGRDLEFFFSFLQDHLGKMPKDKDLAALRPADFRAFLAYRRANGLSSGAWRAIIGYSDIFSFYGA